MPVDDDGLDEAAFARIGRTIGGASDFLRAAIAGPTLLDRVPDGAAIALADADDPALPGANLRAAAVEDAGGAVCVHRVRHPATG